MVDGMNMSLKTRQNSLKAWGALLVAAFPLLLVIGASLFVQPHQEELTMPPPEEPVQYVLDVKHPEQFLKDHLPRVFQKPEHGRLWADAIDKDITIAIHNEKKSASISTIFVDGIRLTGSKYYICIIGEAGKLSDVFTAASQLCNVVDISDDKLVAWYLHASLDPKFRSDVLQMGKSAGIEHSVTLQTSVELRPDRSHSLNYTIYFHIDHDSDLCGRGAFDQRARARGLHRKNDRAQPADLSRSASYQFRFGAPRVKQGHRPGHWKFPSSRWSPPNMMIVCDILRDRNSA